MFQKWHSGTIQQAITFTKQNYLQLLSRIQKNIQDYSEAALLFRCEPNRVCKYICILVLWYILVKLDYITVLHFSAHSFIFGNVLFKS